MLCEAEKVFVLHGVEQNFRIDGRKRGDFRPMELELGLVSHAFGSARLRLANTDVLVAAKLEVDVPYPEKPICGKLEFFVDFSANCSPEFEGRGGEALAVELSNSLASAYQSAQVFDLTRLCILKGHKCWKLLVDVLVLEWGGNLFDAVSLAVKAALWETQVPRVKSVHVDGNKVELDVSVDLEDCKRLDVRGAPVMVTVCKIGEHCVVDPSIAERQCSVGAVIVAASNDMISAVFQARSGSLHPATLQEALEMGHSVARDLDAALMERLKRERVSVEVGFL